MVKKQNKKETDFAVIRSGGQQFLVKNSQEILVDRINSKNGKPVKKGDKVEFEVLLSGKGEAVKLGGPTIKTLKVKGEVMEGALKDKKIIVFKYAPKKRRRNKRGFRSQKTKVKILGV